jgi:hypothetical protein
MNTLENFYMQKHQQESILIQENPGDENPLFKIIIPTRLNAQDQQDTDTPNTATNHTVTAKQLDNTTTDKSNTTYAVKKSHTMS